MPLDLDTGPANETKIVAPQAAARWRAGSSSRVPVMTVTSSLLLIELGSLVGLRAYRVSVWPASRAALQKSRPVWPAGVGGGVSLTTRTSGG